MLTAQPQINSGMGFAAMRCAFAAAAAELPDQLQVRLLRFGDRLTHTAIVGSALGRWFDMIFSHLSDADAKEPAAASIELWDRSATGIGRPPLLQVPEWANGGEAWEITAFGGMRYMREERPASLIWLDRGECRVVATFDDARKFTLAEGARPFNRTMTQICRSLGIQDIHAGLVSRGGSGVLILGGGGRGKTSSSIDCFASGWDFLGDDSVAIARSGADVVGFSLYASARVEPHQTARWPDLRSHWTMPGPADDKALLIPMAFAPERITRRTVIRALALPKITPGPVRVTPASGRDAFRALVHESTENRRFPMRGEDFLLLTDLTRNVPCYRIELSPDAGEVAAGFSEILERACR